MNTENNFILKVHMQDKKLVEVFLNKDRRCFVFEDDDCVADLVLPEFKITSLKMLFNNVSDTKENNDYYAEFYEDKDAIKEYDKDKVNLVKDMVTNISVADFLEYLDRVNINEYYVDNIVDKYNSVIPEEVKRLISYTTNGVKLDDKRDIHILSHDEIMNTDKKFVSNRFIPIFKIYSTYVGYDLKEGKYVEYSNGEKVKVETELESLLIKGDKQEKKKDSLKNHVDKEEFLFEIEPPTEMNESKFEKIEEPKEKTPKEKEVKQEISDAKLQEEVEEAKKYIDLQFDRLNTQVEKVDGDGDKKTDTYELAEKEKYSNKYSINMDEVFRDLDLRLKEKYIEKVNLEDIKLKDYTQEDLDMMKKSILSKIDEVEALNNLEVKVESNDLDEDNEVDTYNLEHESEYDNKYALDLTDIDLKVVDKKEKPDKYKMDLDEIIAGKVKIKHTKPINKEQSHYERKEYITNPDIKLSIEDLMKAPKIDKKADTKPKEGTLDSIKTFVVNEDEIKEISTLNSEVNKENSNDFNTVIEYNKADRNEVKNEIIKSLEKLEAQERNEKLEISKLAKDSLLNSISNYRINFNDTQKLVVEHLPYYKNDFSFGIVQIPDVEVDKITMLPDDTLDFDKFKVSIKELSNKGVDLVVTKATNIVDKDGKSIKRGAHLKLNLDNEINLRYQEHNAMETWTIRMEKSTFTPEFRNIEYQKLMNAIKENTPYDDLQNVEKYEAQKSIMLFIDFVMRDNDTDKLKELYDIIINNPEDYEEYITKYNVDKAHKDKDFLPSYESKKDFQIKYNYVMGLIDAGWLDYPRYIFRSFDYLTRDRLLEEYLEELESSIKENDFSDYLTKLFKKYEMFTNLDSVGKDNLKKCLNYLSLAFKYHPYFGEEAKYKIEKSLMIGVEQEEMALLLSKLCRRGIKDYAAFREYDQNMKEAYRVGELKYPRYSENFGIEDLRDGGEYDEF